MFRLKKIVLATHNKDKIKELKPALTGLGFEVFSTADFDFLKEVEEDAETLDGNALKKARYVHDATGLPALSDDTGLEVAALNGAPGVYSARYAGEHAAYSDNVHKLLNAMKDKIDRRAHFRTVLALVTDSNEFLFEGRCEGEITTAQKGDNGFGYDPIFRPSGFKRTFAELNISEKNEISHRGKAIRKFLDFLHENNP